MPNIMLVEDSRTEASAMRRGLESLSYEVLWAASGDQALLLASEAQPDLILMDIVMPGLNGFQATRQLKRRADTQHIPIIIVSSKCQEIDIVWGQRQGAANYLVKPIELSELHTAIRIELGIDQASAG